MGLFFVLIFSGLFFGVLFDQPTQNHPSNLDLIQLERKIQSGEIRELRVTASEIQVTDREGRDFYTYVDNPSTRGDIVRQAREMDSNNRPRVDKVDENTSEPQVNRLFPIGFAMIFAMHLLTILLMFVLMPLYIILAVKNERLDQTMRIVWVVLTCTAGMFANPVYWYLNVWRAPDSNSPPPQVT
jgi:hypothetical protein